MRSENWTLFCGGALALVLTASAVPSLPTEQNKAAGGLLAPSQKAEPTSPADQYKSILLGNPFRLVPIKPPEAPAPPPPPPDTISLSGITSIIPPAKALLVRTVPGAKEPEYISLPAGEKYFEIEVVSIDEDSGVVKIKNGGVEKTLSFDTDSPKAVAVAPIPGLGAPGMPGAPGIPGAPGNPGFTPQQFGAQSMPAPQLPIPGRSYPMTNGIGSPSTISSPYGQRLPAGASGTTTTQPQLSPSLNVPGLPSRPIRIPTGAQPQSNAQPPPAPVINPDVQTIQMEVSRAINPSDFPPLPPTALTGQ